MSLAPDDKTSDDERKAKAENHRRIVSCLTDTLSLQVEIGESVSVYFPSILLKVLCPLWRADRELSRSLQSARTTKDYLASPNSF